MQGCTTTGYIGILRAAPPRKSAAEKTPATPFPREEMAWTAMAAINIVAHILRTNVDHLPRAPTSRVNQHVSEELVDWDDVFKGDVLIDEVAVCGHRDVVRRTTVHGQNEHSHIWTRAGGCMPDLFIGHP